MSQIILRNSNFVILMQLSLTSISTAFIQYAFNSQKIVMLRGYKICIRQGGSENMLGLLAVTQQSEEVRAMLVCCCLAACTRVDQKLVSASFYFLPSLFLLLSPAILLPVGCYIATIASCSQAQLGLLQLLQAQLQPLDIAT